VSRASSVGIATDDVLDGPGIDPGEGEIFPPAQTGPGAHPASCTMGSGSFPGIKRPRRGVDNTPYLTARLKKEYSCTFTLPPRLRGMF
jgi:hypothetical protein